MIVIIVVLKHVWYTCENVIVFLSGLTPPTKVVGKRVHSKSFIKTNLPVMCHVFFIFIMSVKLSLTRLGKMFFLNSVFFIRNQPCLSIVNYYRESFTVLLVWCTFFSYYSQPATETAFRFRSGLGRNPTFCWYLIGNICIVVLVLIQMSVALVKMYYNYFFLFAEWKVHFLVYMLSRKASLHKWHIMVCCNHSFWIQVVRYKMRKVTIVIICRVLGFTH